MSCKAVFQRHAAFSQLLFKLDILLVLSVFFLLYLEGFAYRKLFTALCDLSEGEGKGREGRSVSLGLYCLLFYTTCRHMLQSQSS